MTVRGSFKFTGLLKMTIQHSENRQKTKLCANLYLCSIMCYLELNYIYNISSM